MSRGAVGPGWPGRCQRCGLQPRYCICPQLPSVHTLTRVVLVRHPRESFKPTGTARIAHLALVDSQLVDSAGGGDDLCGLDLQPGRTWLLLDGPGSTGVADHSWSDEQPRTLVVVDGTWGQARHLATRNERLRDLPRLSLPGSPAPRPRLRQPPVPGARSTLEALAEALGLLEGPAVEAELLALHDLYVRRVQEQRGIPRSELLGRREDPSIDGRVLDGEEGG